MLSLSVPMSLNTLGLLISRPSDSVKCRKSPTLSPASSPGSINACQRPPTRHFDVARRSYLELPRKDFYRERVESCVFHLRERFTYVYRDLRAAPYIVRQLGIVSFGSVTDPPLSAEEQLGHWCAGMLGYYAWEVLQFKGIMLAAQDFVQSRRSRRS